MEDNPNKIISNQQLLRILRIPMNILKKVLLSLSICC